MFSPGQHNQQITLLISDTPAQPQPQAAQETTEPASSVPTVPTVPATPQDHGSSQVEQSLNISFEEEVELVDEAEKNSTSDHLSKMLVMMQKNSVTFAQVREQLIIWQISDPKILSSLLTEL